MAYRHPTCGMTRRRSSPRQERDRRMGSTPLMLLGSPKCTSPYTGVAGAVRNGSCRALVCYGGLKNVRDREYATSVGPIYGVVARCEVPFGAGLARPSPARRRTAPRHPARARSSDRLVICASFVRDASFSFASMATSAQRIALTWCSQIWTLLTDFVPLSEASKHE